KKANEKVNEQADHQIDCDMERNDLTIRKMEYEITALGYTIQSKLLNCQNYGIPTSRERFILIATAPDEVTPNWPEWTHGTDDGLLPLVTIRDALSEQNYPHVSARCRQLQTHGDYAHPAIPDLQNHCFCSRRSVLSWGPNTIGDIDKPICIRELATLSSFPVGSPAIVETSLTLVQVGNAVPPKLAEVVARQIMEAITIRARKIPYGSRAMGISFEDMPIQSDSETDGDVAGRKRGRESDDDGQHRPQKRTK
ncbi:5899_t:CDS:2, partial [Acaulospora colombiana]